MESDAPINLRLLFARAWPIILANAAVPLLGLVDTAVIGNFGRTEDLGAIAFGALIFSFAYWSFGFLRMGTSGFVAQAAGAGDEVEIRASLGRALLIAALLGVILICLQWPLAELAFRLLDGSDAVEAIASDYFFVRIWGAPATLAGFALMGLLVGLGASRQLLFLQLFLNGLNILLDVLFAGVLGMGARGIALGTLCAEWSTVVFGLWLVWRLLKSRTDLKMPMLDLGRLLDRPAMQRALTANLDIMLRTLMLVFAFAFFTNQSAGFGDTLLAANHLLLQLISFSAFFLDGYAFVVESLVGQAKGGGLQTQFRQAVKLSSQLALVTAVALACAILLLGGPLIAALTDIESVRQAAQDLRWLAALYVLLSFAAFQLDGIFIGASCTRQMRDAGAQSLLLFLLAWWLLRPLEITGLWLAFIFYVMVRAFTLWRYYGELSRRIAGPGW